MILGTLLLVRQLLDAEREEETDVGGDDLYFLVALCYF